jgi:hypothetical protein
VQVSYVSEATPGRPNEDFVAAGPGWVVLLDGATAPPGVDSGCSHDPAWLVRRIGGQIAARMALEDGKPLPDLVAEAIKVTGEAHTGTCDLENPDSPSATVSLLRRRGRPGGDVVEWFVLADSPIVLDDEGPRELVRRTRAAEEAEAVARGKRYDDATAVLVRF